MDNYLDFLCFRISAVSRKIARSYNKVCAEHGITPPQSFILFELLAHDGSSIKDIANKVHSDSSAVTGLVDRLLKEDLVNRIEDPSDRRYMQIFLTDRGRQVAVDVLPRSAAFNAQVRKLIGNENIESFEAGLDILLEDW